MFSRFTVNGTKSNELKSQQWKFKLGGRRNFLMKNVVQHWKGWWHPQLQWLISGMVQAEMAPCSSAVTYATFVKCKLLEGEV